MTVYPPKRINGQWIELTAGEILQRDAEIAAAQSELTALTNHEAKIAWATNYLSTQNFRAAIDMVNNSAALTTEEKTLWRGVIKGQAAIALLLRELANDIDVTGW